MRCIRRSSRKLLISENLRSKILIKWVLALRDALVIDKWRRCAPPDKRRRRAVARLLYFIRFTKHNTTQRKKSPCGSGAASLSRFRPAPLFPARRISFFLPYILFGYTVFCRYGLPRFHVGWIRFRPWSPRILSDRTWFFPISSHSFFQPVML